MKNVQDVVGRLLFLILLSAPVLAISCIINLPYQNLAAGDLIPAEMKTVRLHDKIQKNTIKRNWQQDTHKTHQSLAKEASTPKEAGTHEARAKEAEAKMHRYDQKVNKYQKQYDKHLDSFDKPERDRMQKAAESKKSWERMLKPRHR